MILKTFQLPIGRPATLPPEESLVLYECPMYGRGFPCFTDLQFPPTQPFQ